MKIAALFAGIGGLEVGLHRAGHQTLLFAENWPIAAAVLAQRFPHVPNEGDVRELRSLPRKVDLLTAGFPCQDLSQAGKTAGIGGTRSSLVSQVFRLLEDSGSPSRSKRSTSKTRKPSVTPKTSDA
jgi:DNA (cytosine-5)-methyltransferase 1